MSLLATQIEATLLPGMTLPDPLRALFAWIEEKGYHVDNDGGRIGFLFPEAELRSGWTDEGRPGGTTIEFFAEGNVNLKYWFDTESPDILDRLCVFAKTGGEGSMAAFWLDDDGQQRIVHMGSGSGSIMTCVLANDPVDFLRLIAIGYDEICWGGFDEPPSDEDFIVEPNHAYNAWLTQTFGVTIPDRGSEIVKHESEMGDTESPDPFCRWVEQQTG